MTSDIVRQQVFKRDNYTCQECHRNDLDLETHHKIPKQKGGTDSLDNLISLCHKCHKTIEPAWSLYKGVRKAIGKYTVIKVYTKTRDKLAKEGRYNESMADIIERILSEWEK